MRAAYITQTNPRAVLLVGSAATGEVDGYSDVDMILYYDDVPDTRRLANARAEVAAERFTGTDYPGEGYGERYWSAGIHCQTAHALIEPWEREIDRVVVDLDLDQRLIKQLMGLFEGEPLHGEQLIEQWRSRAAYTPQLQRAMIERYWSFFPWWYFEEKLLRRDATIWRYEVLVQSAYNLIGVLAALNGIYYSTFELKRVHAYLDRFELAPDRLAARIESLFAAEPRRATGDVERLVEETRSLVSARFPDLPLPLEWSGKPTPPGSREAPWC